MKAQKKIHLKPGFRAEAGAYFRASIFHYSCNTGSNKSLYSDVSFCRENAPEQKDAGLFAYNYFDTPDVGPNQGVENKNIPENNLGYAIYPNPNNGRFNVLISSDNSNKFNLNITDIVGKTVYSKQNLSGTEQTVNIINLNSGIYFVKIDINGEVVYSDKVIKK